MVEIRAAEGEDMPSPDMDASPLTFNFPMMTPRTESTSKVTDKNNQPVDYQPTPTTSTTTSDAYALGNLGSISLSDNLLSDVPPPKTLAMPRTPSAQHKQMRKFARSADKRQSVHMLGSIQHLQRHFMKFGLAAGEDCDVKELDIGSFPALTTLAPTKPINTTNNDVISTSRAESSGSTVAKSPFLLETPKLDPGKLRREAFDALKALEEAWLIDTDSEHMRTASPPRDQQEGAVEVKPPTKILSLLKTTVDAVRAVRAWSLAVPATSLLRSSAVIRQNDYTRTSLTKPRIPTMSTPSRPAPASQSSRSVSDTSIRLAARHGNGQIISGGGGEEKDPLSDLRKAALDVLACLRGVEERFRTTDDSADNSFEDLHEEEMPGQATSVSPDRRQQQQRSLPSKAPQSDTQLSTISIKRIEDSEDLWFFSQRAGESLPSGEWTEEEKKGWYERLMSGEAGWTYRPDIRVGVELQEEREVVRRYLDTVVDTFFGATTGEGNEVPWRRKVMRGEDERELRLDDVGSEVEDGNEARLQKSTESEFARLPDWADSPLWEGRRIERIRAFLEDHLPTNMLGSLPASESDGLRIKLLTRLSDGYLLTLAFNTVLRHTAKGSWGFIPDEDVYDTLDSGTAATSTTSTLDLSNPAEGDTSARRQKDWTFRKAGNLRCWGAALKLRYSVPLAFPLQAVDLQLVIPVIQTLEAGTHSSTASRPPSSSPSRRPSEHTTSRKTSTAGGGVLEDGSGGVGIPFDPIRIARREEGWDGMLEAALAAWVDKVSLELLSVGK